MGFSLAKKTGRNRAFGVRAFANFHRAPLKEIERDLDQAWRAGHVDLNLVLGG